MKKNLLTLSTVMSIFLMFSANAEAKSSALYAGYSTSEDSQYGYVGGVKSLNGDLQKDGFLAKVGVGYGSYEYSFIANNTQNTFDGKLASGDIMVGYQKFFDIGRATLYLGGNYESHEVSPKDVTNSVTGGEAGAKAQLELALNFFDKLRVSHASSYSEVFESYWTTNMIGWDFGIFTFGPEATFLGSESFDQQRYGAAFANIDLAGFAKLKVAGGTMEASRRGDDGFYASIGVSSQF